ncbi:permease prefix domain 2-containing transporter [Rhodocytophaga aerolata]|uniref:Permease prefix domain 2-containing transporter n=1 Tax=Rhodocytophaga aerolata TaxID=455078 RepID=A0ABT8RHD5_9BACT|nr:permease prefix domain 2-containing transporter [Rhodocytophaga aerolata]MDO1451399.1 permease prefix domain 2-containing transporter [Rhodocytophaga aerolata]
MQAKHTSHPPRWATKLLEWLCPEELLEEIEGDLQELFEERVEEVGEKKARREYIRSVFGYLRPFAFSKTTNPSMKPLYLDMLRNYLTIAIRMLLRNKLRTAIHMLGLSIGISTCLALYQIISFELSFDQHIPDRERIYQVMMQVEHKEEKHTNYMVPGPTHAAIRKEITGLEQIASFYTLYGARVKVVAGHERKTFTSQHDVTFANPDVLRLLSYEWISGSAETALSAPYQVVLTEQKVQKYFGDIAPEKAIGRELIYLDSIRVMVSGVVHSREANTDFVFNDFISLSTIEQTALNKTFYFEEWGYLASASRAFVKLSPSATPEGVNRQLATLSDKYGSKENSFALQLQPFREVHFKGADLGRSGPTLANLPALYGLGMIALFILLIACINFINLETAQAIYRAKEVGIRKTLGSKRSELIWQFQSETLLITLLATLLSLAFAKGILLYFAEMIPQGVTLSVFSPATLLFLLSLLILVAFLAGFYPAIVLSGYSPIKALRKGVSSLSRQTRSAFMRKNLTVIQFALSQVFIFATLVIGGQIRHMLELDMGFDKEAIIYMHLPRQATDDGHILFTGRIGQVEGVAAASLSNSTPASNSMWTNEVHFASPAGKTPYQVQQKVGDSTYLKLYDIPILAGRNIGNKGDETLINDTFRKKLGFTHAGQALGQTLYMMDQPYTIVGVMADFHLRPLSEAILPAMYRYDFNRYMVLNVKLQTGGKTAGEVKQTLARLEALWKEQYPDEEFTYTFLDETITKFYQTEANILKMLWVATGIAILISCLGLLGLSAFTIAQRTKEIGIRKVLGASVSQIVGLLSKDFLKVILIAFVVAAPIAWLLLSRWLEDFEYRITLQWWMFVMVGGLALLAALLTVSSQSIRAALTNPAKSLRSE